MSRRPVFLVGFMGAGKSAVGEELARRLGVPFLDTDDLIESAAGQTIASLFADRGEPAFRALERIALRDVIGGAPTPRVIATGGGLFVDPENRRRVNDCGWSLWLDVPLEALLRRLGEARDRPLFAGPDAVRNLYRQRREAYTQAHARVDASADSVALVVERALLALESLGWGDA